MDKVWIFSGTTHILGDPGASSRDDAIFLAKVYFKSRRAPGYLFTPEVLEFHPAGWSENDFLANQ